MNEKKKKELVYWTKHYVLELQVKKGKIGWKRGTVLLGCNLHSLFGIYFITSYFLPIA